MYQTDKCVVAQVLKVVVIINLIIIDHSGMIQAFRFIEISKYDDGGQLTTHGQLMQGSSTVKLNRTGYSGRRLFQRHSVFNMELEYVTEKDLK